ncbi:hypothetical protein J6590_068057 [Homalodisca vitripennis]|nr:hypothetical protein J6590_068057 [Homalodisca vitripennis]
METQTVNTKLEMSDSTQHELAQTELDGKHSQNTAGTTGQTPAGQLEEALNLLSAPIENTKAENHPLIVMGDINVEGLKSDRNNQMLNNTLSSHSISRLPLPPTRVTPTSISSIDFICTNLDKEQLTSTVIHAGISDHTAHICEIKYITTSSSQKNTILKVLNQENLNLLKAQFEQENLENVQNADSAETAYNDFLSTIVAIMNTVCPRKTV